MGDAPVQIDLGHPRSRWNGYTPVPTIFLFLQGLQGTQVREATAASRKRKL